MVNDQDFPKLTGGLNKGGGTGQRRIRYKSMGLITSYFFRGILLASKANLWKSSCSLNYQFYVLLEINKFIIFQKS